jgi:hypothetical protein
MPKRKQVKSFKSDTMPEKKMILRMVTVRAETANDSDKSMEVVIASENPVERFDEDRGQVVREILSMDGLKLRGGKNKLPIVDSHDRSTIRNVLGSVQNLHIDGTELVGDAKFARDAASQDAYWKLKDGHVDDFSITATPNEVEHIQRGEQGIFRESEIHGPADIVTNWTPTDASLVAVGADETSTKRGVLLRSYTDLKRKGQPMTEDQRAALIGRGMPDELETDKDALDWMIQNMAEEEEKPEDDIENECDGEECEDEKPEDDIEKMDGEEEEEEESKAVARALKNDASRRKEIRSLCKQAKITRAFADKLCNDPKITLPIARKKVLNKMVSRSTPLGSGRIEVGSSGFDRQTSAMRDGLIIRAMGAIAPQRDRSGGLVERKSPFANGKPAAGAQDFASMGMLRMAEEILRSGGANTTRMTPQQIALCAMGHPKTLQRMAHNGYIRRDDAWHTTGTFTNLMLDAQNKTLLAGYEEADFTWGIWARQAPSVADFRTINRIKFSEAPDPSVVPEGNKYPEGKTSDEKESYTVEKYGEIFSVTWETIVGDDLDALSRIPQMHGAACRRKQNKVVYANLTANAAMADGVALFNSAHNNLAGSGAVISTATLNAAFTAMRTQTNLGGEIISVVPRFLIVPAAIEATAWSVVNSIADPSVGGDTTGSSGVANVYGPGGPRRLVVVGEPQLDGASATSWYLAAGNTQVDTVELSFLQGEESPVLESEWCFDTDVYKNKVRQTFGTKVFDFRGLYKNPGA